MQDVTIDTEAVGLWGAIRESLAGSHRRDYTEGPIGRAILLLAVPMVLELVLESVFAVVDVFFVSRLGADAVATVGLTESMLSIVYAAAIGLSVGAMATVARRIGEISTARRAPPCKRSRSASWSRFRSASSAHSPPRGC
jgi:hypothetical protein